MWKQSQHLFKLVAAYSFSKKGVVIESSKRLFQIKSSLLFRYAVVLFLLQGCQNNHVLSQPNIEQKQESLEQVDLQKLTSKKLLKERSIPLSMS